MLRYLAWPVVFTILGLAGCWWLGWRTTGTFAGGSTFLLIGTVLSVLEISLSFDNAIVNANKLEQMTEAWRRRFLTWGILIAVFGMRILFPLAIVAVAAKINPIAAIELAASRPDEYERIIGGAQVSISAFGGTFLMMVALRYFIDDEKDVHWIRLMEVRLAKWSVIRSIEIVILLVVVVAFSFLLPSAEATTFLMASIFGLLTFLCVETVGQFLDAPQEATAAAARGGLGAFLYLELLDASFSFDGVIGAFALTNNLFLIAIGLGVGAFYVRSITIMLVDRKTLKAFRYLEHGAFYSILALSIIMFAQTIIHVPELVTGLLSATLIGLALVSSILHNRSQRM